MSIRRYCRIFLRSFDAHFLFLRVVAYSNFTHLGAFLIQNFPPYFFAGIRATSCATFRLNTSVGNADRSRLCGECPTMAWNVMNGVIARFTRRYCDIVKSFCVKLSKNAGYIGIFVVLYVLTKGDFLWQLKSY